MNKSLTALFLVGTVALSGCSTFSQGRKFDEKQVSEIQKGKSTRSEVVAMFGEPASKSHDQNGDEKLTYFYSETKSKVDPRIFIPIVGLFFMNAKAESQSRTLLVMLKENVVTNYTYDESGSLGTSIMGPQ